MQKRINRRKLDVWVSELEGGKRNLPIAQISEVRRWCCAYLGALVLSGRAPEVLTMLQDQAKAETRALRNSATLDHVK